jgi:chitinase
LADTGSGATTPEAGDDSGGNDAVDASPDVGAVGIPAVKAVIYLDNWSGSFASWSTKIDFTKMTYLNLAFATVSGTNSWGNSLGDTGDVQTIAAAAHAKGVKVLVSIGGGGGDQTVISAYQSASNIAPLVANLDTMVNAMNLDGVDVDLESPGSMTSSSNYPAFISALISTFHAEGKLVTTASAQYIVQGQNTDAPIVAAVNSFDFINDMVYSNNVSDYTNEASWWTGSPVNLPSQNLVLGICFGECGGTPTVSMVQQVTMDSLAYGGVMGWDYTDAAESTLWPAMQGAL